MARKENDLSTPIDKEVSSKIKSLRMHRGMTQQALGKAIGVSIQQIQKYESGRNRISIGRLILIADVFGKKLDYFYITHEIIDTLDISETPHQKWCKEIVENIFKIRNPQYQNILTDVVCTLAKKAA